MLPLALKAVWFALCVLGTISAWVTLFAFARAVGSYWGPMFYCMALTLLQGAICLGMIWQMDPFLMPRSFCLAQIAVINFSAFLLTGICACLSITITILVLWPAENTPNYSPFKWRNLYIIPLAVFPIMGTVAEMVVGIKLGATQPADNIQCDVNHPLWVRFLGYAGLPLLESIPCCLLAIFALIRIVRMHQIHERLSRDVAIGYTFDVTTFSVRPSTASKHEPADTLYPNPSPHFSSSSSPRAVTSSRPPSTNPGPSAILTTAFLSPSNHFRHEASARQFHLPFKTTDESESQGSLVSPKSLPQEVHVRVDSHASSALPASTPLNHADDNDDLRRASPYIVFEDRDVESDATHEDRSSFDDRVSSVVFNRNSSPKSELDIERGIKDQEQHHTDEDPRYATLRERSSKLALPPQKLFASIWRLLLFQLGFWTVQALMILSTLICVIRNRPPMAFGTEHVAALLSAWGPFIIFSHQDGVRKQLVFWRRPATTS